MKIVALIPSRPGSKRIPGKNTKLLAGHPLIAYSIASALESGVFAGVYACLGVQDEATMAIAEHYGATVLMRTTPTTADDAPDILWVREVITFFDKPTTRPDAFAILRPTSPFRSAAHLQLAVARFIACGQAIDSLRAIRPVQEHPGKMWWVHDTRDEIMPALQMNWYEMSGGVLTPWHSQPTQMLPICYVQTSSLEIAWTRVIHDTNTISGTRIAPWIVDGDDPNGWALDTPADWAHAEAARAAGTAQLPALSVASLSTGTPAL